MDFKQLAALILVAVWAVLVIKRRRDTQLGAASQAWPATRGRILRAFIGDHGDGDSNRILHSANVEYVYSVGQREYRSRRLAFGDTRGLQFADAIDLLQGLVQGREVDVFYDPGKPQRSVLIRGAVAGHRLSTCIDIVLAAVVLYWLLT